jgi:iron-sulfur cluster assembly protein
LDFEKAPASTDIVFEEHGVKLFVDKESMEFLKGTTIDYIDGLRGSGFKIENPNVQNSCGCGKSFC